MTTSLRVRWLLVAGLVLSAGLAEAQVALPTVPKPPFADPQDAITARKIGFKGNGDITKAMKAAIDGGQDVAPFAASAQWLADWAKQIPDMFPKGSETGHETKALPAIWTDTATFDKDAGDFAAAATKLTELAKADDKAGFADQFKVMGGTCGACHREFRAK